MVVVIHVFIEERLTEFSHHAPNFSLMFLSGKKCNARHYAIMQNCKAILKTNVRNSKRT